MCYRSKRKSINLILNLQRSQDNFNYIRIIRVWSYDPHFFILFKMWDTYEDHLIWRTRDWTYLEYSSNYEHKTNGTVELLVLKQLNQASALLLKSWKSELSLRRIHKRFEIAPIPPEIRKTGGNFPSKYGHLSQGLISRTCLRSCKKLNLINHSKRECNSKAILCTFLGHSGIMEIDVSLL